MVEQYPNPDSMAIMSDIDGLRPELRALVYEYGWIIVRDCYDGGDIENLAFDLQTWRERRQEAIAQGRWEP